MERRILFLVSWCLLSLSLLTGAKALPDLSCQAACVMEIDTGRVLYENQADVELPMASTTKIMTALLVIEAGDLDRVVTIPRQAVGVEGSSVYLKEGEQFSRKSLLYALMLASGNDVAVALAIDIAGSVNEFVSLMNQRAEKIGAKSTNFANPHGLPAEGHYTTAHDLALISAVAMRDPTFCEIVETKSIVIEPQTEGARRTLQNKNKLLWQFDGAMGIKTGYTKAAGKCLVGAADRDGKRIVAVVLNAPDMWSDIEVLMEDSLGRLSHVTLKKKGETVGSVSVRGGTAVSVSGILECDITSCLTQDEMQRIEYKVFLPDGIDAPVMQGDVIGHMEVILDGISLKKVNILAKGDIPKCTYPLCIIRMIKLWIGVSP